MRTRSLATKSLIYLMLCFAAIIVFFPMYITVITAFKTPAQSTENFFALPSSLYIGNFRQVIESAKFLIYVKNSLLITIISVGVISVFCPMVSYGIARNMYKNKFYKSMYFYFVTSIFIPFQVVMVPLVMFVSKMKLMSQYGLMLLYITYALHQGVFLYVGYLKSIPMEMEEAAIIDGCSVWQTFIRIIYPISKPMTATIIILNTLWIWNDFLLPLLILNRSSDFWTLPLFQYNFKSQFTFDFNLAFASFMFSIVPVMIFYMFLQKNIIQGLTSGAVKS